MSVLIKGMQKPKDCYQCRLHYGHGECGVSVDGNCPLIELPDHGDLIDRDALWQKMKDLHEKRTEEANMTGDSRVVVCVTWHDAVVLGKNAPVVIPAERSEDA